MRCDATNIYARSAAHGATDDDILPHGILLNILNFTRARDKVCHRQIRPRSFARANPSKIMCVTRATFFTGRLSKITVRRLFRSTENNFLIRENGLEIGTIGFIVPPRC